MHGADGVEAAGHVIMSFGQFVVGGNFVVGVVVFLVLIAIQFIVINHGAVRISEVTARFTLDAMPGRQMAIDADLNAGLIDEQRSARRAASGSAARPTSTARWTARSVSPSATRWRPMLITGVNIVAGLIIGVFQHGLDLSDRRADLHDPDRRRRPGDGDSGAARVDVRRPDHDARGVGVAPRRRSRRCSCSRAPGRWRVAAAVLTALALIPGLPKLVVPRRGRACSAAPRMPIARDADSAERTKPRTGAAADASDGRRPRRSARASKSATRSSRSSTRSRAARCSIARARDPQADRRARPAWSCRRCTSPTTCSSGRGPTRFSSRASRWRAASCMPDRLLAINPGTATAPLEGSADARAGVRPAGAGGFRPSSAIAPSAAGYTVVDPTTALSTHLSEIDSHVPAGSAQPPADQGAGRPRRRRPRRSWSRSSCPRCVSLGEIQRVLRQLLRERVPVRDLTTILEAIADAAAVDEGPRRDDRGGARRARTGDLPASTRTSAASCRRSRSAPALEERAAVVDRADRAGRRAGARPDAGAETGGADRRARCETAVAQPVLLCTPSAPASSLAAVRAGAAAHRRALAQRSAAARRGSPPSPCSTDMHLKRFRGQTVRDALRAVREELGPTRSCSRPRWSRREGGADLSAVAKSKSPLPSSAKCRRSGRRGRSPDSPLPRLCRTRSVASPNGSSPPGSPPMSRVA